MLRRRKWLLKKKALSRMEDEERTAIKVYLEAEMLKLVKKEQSKKFCEIYWMTSIRYNHLLVWLI